MYKKMSKQTIIRLSDGFGIPKSLTNPDYQKYLKWLAEGNIPEPVDPKPLEQIAAEELAEQKKTKRLANKINNFSFEDIKTYIDSKIPPDGQTEQINDVINKLAELIKALS